MKIAAKWIKQYKSERGRSESLVFKITNITINEVQMFG